MNLKGFDRVDVATSRFEPLIRLAYQVRGGLQGCRATGPAEWRTSRKIADGHASGRIGELDRSRCVLCGAPDTGPDRSAGQAIQEGQRSAEERKTQRQPNGSIISSTSEKSECRASRLAAADQDQIGLVRPCRAGIQARRFPKPQAPTTPIAESLRSLVSQVPSGLRHPGVWVTR